MTIENPNGPQLEDIEVRNLLRLHEQGKGTLAAKPRPELAGAAAGVAAPPKTVATAPQPTASCPPHVRVPDVIPPGSGRAGRPMEFSPPLASAAQFAQTAGDVFIGHGRSPLWRELKDFLQDRLKLKAVEFNSMPVAGMTTLERLEYLLQHAKFAFLVLTAEDERGDGRMVARMNVVHEVGLFQGRLGFHRAIVLLEDGCADFSNIHGLGCIRFPRGEISHKFEDIRHVLEREGLI